MKIIVNPHTLQIIKEEIVNEREIDISKCVFEFDEEITNEYVKEAYFTLKDKTYKQLIINNECSFPSEVLEEKGQIEIGVVAYLVESEEEIKRYNPRPAYFTTTEGSLKDNAENTEPITPTDKEQIEQAITSLQTNKADKTEIPDVSDFITKEVNNLTYYTLGTETGSSIEMSIDTTTYILTISLKNSDNQILNTQTVDLPIESMIVNGSYDSINKKIILTLQNGNIIEIPVGDLINGLQTEITSDNKLSSDLVDDTNNTHKFVSASEKELWNNKSDFSGNYNDLSNKPSIPSKTSDLTNDSGFIDNTVNNLTNYTKTSSLSTVATSGSYNDLSNKPTIPDELADLSDDSTHRLVSDTEKSTWNSKSDFSGSYNDLTDKPAIPTVPTNVSAFTNDAGYTTNTGTITSVKMNGSTVSSSGEADLGTVITQHQDISGKLDTSAVKTSTNTTQGNVYDVTYINTMLGDVESLLGGI